METPSADFRTLLDIGRLFSTKNRCRSPSQLFDAVQWGGKRKGKGKGKDVAGEDEWVTTKSLDVNVSCLGNLTISCASHRILIGTATTMYLQRLSISAGCASEHTANVARSAMHEPATPTSSVII
jgi:hypothetical protein